MSDPKDGFQKDVHYWQSFEDLYSDPKFLEQKENEFKDGANEAPDTSSMSSLSRRKFLTLLGASAAVAGTACSDYPEKGEIVPYKNKPEEITLGKANYYASTCTGCSAACGILIKTREGRPVKIDGNPDHPVSKGKICAQGQAGIMGLYDPDRIKSPMSKRGNGFIDADWQEIDDEIILALSTVGNSEIAIITNRIVSPTENEVLNNFIEEYPSAKIYSYEQFNAGVKDKAWQKCYGSEFYPFIKLNEAEIIVSLDADFLGTDSNKVENMRLFSEGRDVMNKKFNRLYSIESNMSLTGLNSDYRIRLKPDLQYDLVMSLLNELQRRNIISNELSTSSFNLNSFAIENNLSEKVLNHLIDDLVKNSGKSFVYAGDHLPENVHIAVNYLNEQLGNSILYDTDRSKESSRDLTTMDEIKDLIGRMNSGNVGMVIHYGSNPVYNLPADLDYSSAIQNVDLVVTLSELTNESSHLSNFVLPVHHNFEAWGDSKTERGFYSLQQPVIAPLYNTRQKESALLTWINGDSFSYNETVYHEYLINNWERNIYPGLISGLGFKQTWYAALHDGVIKSKDSDQNLFNFNNSAFTELPDNKSKSNGINVYIKESYSIRDGRFANNGWMQELPHPISKVTWDNYAAISATTATNLGVENGDMLDLAVNGNSLSIPAFIQPGLSDDTVVIEAGFGREKSGTVAENVGFNVNQLISSVDGLTPWLFTGAEVSKTSGSYKLVVAQEIIDLNNEKLTKMPKERGIIQEGTVNKYIKDPEFLKHDEEAHLVSVNPPIAYDGLKWGMSIDLNKCTGCSECVVACNVENNIPVVGKEEVDKGREMHWLRIDRYYSGSPEEPKVNVQPMLCQHCDQAPCENVCPVVATAHSPDGLNQMVYNRCVGTRYCSDNCPYKVRRFNFYNFRSEFNDGYQESPVFAFLQNPEVTVRSRGVMEKCTFCIQRISEARSDATKEGRNIKGTDVTTACKDACGTSAIKFGDINDENSEFYKYRNHELGYYVLEELNIKPNVTYLAKLRNSHSEDI
ncbi:TAT-variant-translocated molybdopterin oxidoreductase [Bacteroidota bacterium]